MICMKNLRFSSRPRAKVRRQGPPGSARAQPWLRTVGIFMRQDAEVTKSLPSIIHTINLTTIW